MCLVFIFLMSQLIHPCILWKKVKFFKVSDFKWFQVALRDFNCVTHITYKTHSSYINHTTYIT